MKPSDSPSTESSIIQMTDVAVAPASAPDTIAIERVNWTVETGDYWIVGGLPGSGKSDLLATAGALLRPLHGTHRLFGQDMAALSEEEAVRVRMRVGLVFSNEGRLFNHLTIAENLALPICYHRNCTTAEARDRVDAVLDALGLSEIAQNRPRSVNRNMRVRVALARALALAPEVLLLDDPLRGLDPIQMKWLLEFLSRLCSGDPIIGRCKMTLVIATENFRPWTQQGKRFALIRDKQWFVLGGPAEFTEHPDPLLRELMATGF